MGMNDGVRRVKKLCQKKRIVQNKDRKAWYCRMPSIRKLAIGGGSQKYKSREKYSEEIVPQFWLQVITMILISYP